jgi:nitronate monooxygenase
VQVGTAFAFCRESGLADELKRDVLRRVARSETTVFTDPLASPTGFPFKIVQLPGSASSEAEYAARPRICDLGYLRELYKREDGTVGYRCPAEPIGDYLDKGGDLAETTGRKCLCNGLLANIGLGQRRERGYLEPPLLTAGDDLANLARLLPPGADAYGAAGVLRYLLTPQAANY